MQRVEIEVESSRYATGSYWQPGAEYYAELVLLDVADTVDVASLSDEALLDMADDESNPFVCYVVTNN